MHALCSYFIILADSASTRTEIVSETDNLILTNSLCYFAGFTTGNCKPFQFILSGQRFVNGFGLSVTMQRLVSIDYLDHIDLAVQLKCNNACDIEQELAFFYTKFPS